THCFVSWIGGGDVHHAIVDGTAIGPSFTIPIDEHSADVASDGARMVAFDDHALVEYDVATATMRVLLDEQRCVLDDAAATPWAPAGVVVATCKDVVSLRLVPTAGGRWRTLARFPAIVTGLAPLGDDDIVYSTIGYDSRLVLLDGLPIR